MQSTLKHTINLTMSTRLLWLYITFYITSYALDLGEKRDILDLHNSLRNDIAAMEPANLNQLFWVLR